MCEVSGILILALTVFRLRCMRMALRCENMVLSVVLSFSSLCTKSEGAGIPPCAGVKGEGPLRAFGTFPSAGKVQEENFNFDVVPGR